MNHGKLPVGSWLVSLGRSTSWGFKPPRSPPSFNMNHCSLPWSLLTAYASGRAPPSLVLAKGGERSAALPSLGLRGPPNCCESSHQPGPLLVIATDAGAGVGAVAAALSDLPVLLDTAASGTPPARHDAARHLPVRPPSGKG